MPAVLATNPDLLVVGLDLSPEMLAMGRAKLVQADRTNVVLVRADDRPPRFGWLVDAYFRLGEPAHAREVVGDGLARLLRVAGFAVEREGPQGAVPMQILAARPSGR